MILKVNKDICEIKQNEVWNVGDYNVHTVQVELSEEFNGLVNKVRYFVEDKSYDMLITDNVAQVPYEATVMEGTIKIGVYGYDADTDILVQSTSPVNKYITSGTYTGDADNTQPLTPTDKEQMETAIQKNTDDIINLQNNKQDVLISGENIKTINNESILGNGNIEIDVGSINYNDLENKPKINNVELNGNKSLSDLGIQPAGNYALESEIPDVSNFITKDVNNLTYYTLSSDLSSVATSGSYNDLINKPNLSIYATVTNLNNEISARENADANLQNQIDAITLSSDVIDVLGTYQELQNYDTSHVKANDIIKILQDSTHSNAMSYYRWVITNNNGSWVYVGSEGPYYTKGEADTLLNDKQNIITSSNKLNADLVDDTNSINKFVTTSEKSTWDGKQDIIQYSTMPVASEELEGKIVQYIGDSTLDYTNGYFYICESVGGEYITYKWTDIYVQEPPNLANYLSKNNTTAYTPTGDYNPATKKYVDDSASTVVNNIAPVYSDQSTYAIGDYVLYDKVLYVCNTTISIAESWTVAHWTQTNIATILGNIETALAVI